MEKCSTTFNEAQPSYSVSCMTIFSGKTSLLQTNRQGLPLSKKLYSCRNIQDVERWTTPLNKVQTPSQFFAWHLFWKEKTSLLQNNDACFVQMFHSYGRVSCTQTTTMTCFFQKYDIHPRVLLHSDAFLCIYMNFNQMVHSLAKEAFHILAPTFSLRNTIIIV